MNPLSIPTSLKDAVSAAKNAVGDGIRAGSDYHSANYLEEQRQNSIAYSQPPTVTSEVIGENPPDLPRAPRMGDFVDMVRRKSISRQSHFYTSIFPPNTLIDDYSDPETIEQISLYIEQASLPEMAIITMQTHATGIGIDIPYDKSFGQTVMTFVCDQDMVIKSFFDRWIMSIMNTPNGVFEYYDDYVIPELPVVVTDAALNPVYMVVFHNAYPKLINDMYLSSNSRDVNRIQVQFAYSQWRSYSIVSTSENSQSQISGIVPDQIREYGNAYSDTGYGVGNGYGENRYGTRSNYRKVPGIDQIALGTMLSVLGSNDKGTAAKRQSKGILREMSKPYKQRIMEMIPGSVRPLAGSVISQSSKGWF